MKSKMLMNPFMAMISVVLPLKAKTGTFYIPPVKRTMKRLALLVLSISLFLQGVSFGDDAWR
ncbi:MAG: hypothetical protein SWE60_09475 [Thermodesulfobacteriota bacterium]|nr:hypothetical protein [Thermodesulfobacteriota bacterium]